MLVENVSKEAKIFIKQRFSVRNFTFTPRRHICLTQASTNNFFTNIDALCNNMTFQVEKIKL